ncbi:hypothetical protein ACI7BZ_04430 [Xanthobacter sp. AM11]|uniref:hypothetical protein n=1 Tax=Xanthobacter sp. AM11 TaxID=3380643 RepID=UPI0039BFF604
MKRRAFLIAGAGAAALLGLDLALTLRRPTSPALMTGVVWQLHAGALDPRGDWDLLGARSLLLQWMVADGTAFVPGLGLPLIANAPNWQRIAREPWARSIIAGLAGSFNEPTARRNVAELAALSARIAAKPLPFEAAGFYFPVEADPTWSGVADLGRLLAPIARPLWVSAYDNSNVGPGAMADWVSSWLPADVGLFFQDGVGIHTRTPEAARAYATALSERLGAHRFKLIAEAFRPAPGGSFRAATAAELRPQLQMYAGFDVFVFDGPHYLDRVMVQDLLAG